MQLGLWLTRQVGLFGQFEEAPLGDDLGLLPISRTSTTTPRWPQLPVRPDLLLKVEYHSATTRFPLGLPESQMGVGSDPVDVEWIILALSVSF